MTTTIVFGDVADGYLHSTDPAYATARNGPADGVNTGTIASYGQNNNGGAYTTFQTFLRFAYPAVAASSRVAAASIQTFQVGHISAGTARDMEVRAFAWGTSLALADWRTPAQLAAAGIFAVVRGVQDSRGKWATAGSEALRADVQTSTFQELVLVSSRQRAGSTPTTDEGSSIATADQAGTSFDPRLVFTTTTDQSLMPAVGGEARLSDGSWVFLARPALSPIAVDLWRQTPDGAPAVTLASIPMGFTSSTWSNVQALQGLTLTVDAQDNIYIVGRAGDAPNVIRVQAHRKAPGSWSWSPGQVLLQGLPAHDAAVNNVTAAWHSTGGGTLVVFAAHGAGDGVSGGLANDVSYLLLGTSSLLSGAGFPVRGSGSAQDAGLTPAGGPSEDFSSHANEVGTGLDVVADAGQPDWGYVASFRRSQRVGENRALAVGRYILNGAGSGFTHASYQDSGAYGTKDAGARVRLLAVGSGQVALVTADKDSGQGLTVEVLQASGAAAGLVSLGRSALAGESITAMPDGPVVAFSPAWDAVYSAGENAVWVYFVDSGNPLHLRRTSVNLTTYQATRVTVGVHTAGTAISVVRAPRNARVTGKGHVTVGGTPSAHASVVDTFNQPPLAPVLAPRPNYDATIGAFFSWTFGDLNAGDAQSAYQFQVVRVSDGVTVLDSGKTISTAPTRSVVGGTLANGQDYRWRVMTWDASDLAGPWSDYGTFTTSAGGSVNITTPAVDNPPGVATDDYGVAWTVTGTTQASFRVWVTRNDTGATVHDSGFTAGTATAWTFWGMVSDVEHTIRVQVRNASNVASGIGSRLITPSYGTPEVPLVTVTPTTEGGYVLVSVDNPVPGEPASTFPFWDFEGVPDFGPWVKFGATLAVDSTTFRRGAQSAKLTATGSGATQAFVRSPAVAITPGQRYALRAWLMAPVTRDLTLTIDWYGPGDTYIDSAFALVTMAAGVWAEVATSGLAPAEAETAIYGWGVPGTPAAGAAAYADDLWLAPASDRPEVVRNRIFRRTAGSQGPWDVLGEVGPDGSFRDYTAAGRVPLEYMVRGESA